MFVGTFFYLVMLAVLYAHPGSHTPNKMHWDIGLIAAPLFASVCPIVYAFQGRTSFVLARSGWLWVGMSYLAFTAGQIYYSFSERHGQDVPVPSWADAGYLLMGPLLVVGVFQLFGAMPVASRARLVLDNAIVASSGGLLSWYFLVRHVWNQSDISFLGKVVSVAYPIEDIMVIFSILVLLNAVSGRAVNRRPFVFLAVGSVVMALTDTIYTNDTLNNTYFSGIWYDWGYALSPLLIGYGALDALWLSKTETALSDRNGEEYPPRIVHPLLSFLRLIAPYLLVTFVFSLVVIHDYRQDGLISNGVSVSGWALILLVILRQVFTLVENQHLTRQLRLFNETLEQSVADRTQQLARRTSQLSALQMLTKAINNTRQIASVAAAGMWHTKEILHSDAVLVRFSVESIQNSSSDLCFEQGLSDHIAIRNWLSQEIMGESVQILPLPMGINAAHFTGGICLKAPLRWQGRQVGMICAIRWHGVFEPDEWELLESIGVELGTALQNARQYEAAVDAADRDSLTGLYNHRAIHQRLDQEAAKRPEGPVALIMMDMDNFKLFNDTYGHPEGDQVLKRVTQALVYVCGLSAIVGRYGGDEFCVILPGSGAEEAAEMARRIRRHLAAHGFTKRGEERAVPITLSFGIAVLPEDSPDRHELITIADTNLYTAKNSEEGIAQTTCQQRENRMLYAESSFSALDALVTAIDNKDRYTRRHSEDVTEFALWIAEEIKLSEETLRVIRVGGLLHDVGKICVPDHILRKPGRLTPEEYEVMKRHPQTGGLIVGGLPGMEDVLDAVRYHHERWDGQGYPEGLQGEEIPLVGRILAIADAMSAMTTDRPYRKGLTWQTALEEIRANINTQFDPLLAQAFLRTAQQRGQLKSLSEIIIPIELQQAAERRAA